MGRPNPHKGKSLAQLAAEMNETQRRAIEYALAHRGATRQEVADALGISCDQAKRVMASEKVRRALGAVTAEIVEASTDSAIVLLRAGMIDAAKALTAILKNGTNMERIAASRVIFAVLADMGEFDAGGEGPEQHKEKPAAVVFLTSGDEGANATTAAVSN